MLDALLQILAYSAAAATLMMAAYFATGTFGAHKKPAVFAHYKISSDIDNGSLKKLCSLLASSRIPGWNRFIFGEPYVVLESFYDKKYSEMFLSVPQGFESRFLQSGLAGDLQVQRTEELPVLQSSHFRTGRLKYKKRTSVSELRGLCAGGICGAVLQIGLRKGGTAGFESEARIIAHGDENETSALIHRFKNHPHAVLVSSESLSDKISARDFKDIKNDINFHD